MVDQLINSATMKSWNLPCDLLLLYMALCCLTITPVVQFPHQQSCQWSICITIWILDITCLEATNLQHPFTRMIWHYNCWFYTLSNVDSTRDVCHTRYLWYETVICFINSLASGRPGWQSKTATFNLVSLIGNFTSSKDNALRWMPRDLTNNKSTLVQVMAWCHQAASHYLNQCWPRSPMLYGITSP